MEPRKQQPGMVGRIGSGEDTDCICRYCNQIKLKIHCAEVKDKPKTNARWVCLSCLKKNEQPAGVILTRSRPDIPGPSGHKRPV